jgi:hypothetical protein
MHKNISRLEYNINERTYHFTCDPDSPLQDVKEVLFQIMKYIGHIEDQIKLAKEKLAAEKAPEQQSGDTNVVIPSV